MTDLAVTDGYVDLWQQGFMFAISDIDPAIGEISITVVRRNTAMDKKEVIPLKLVNCKELLEGGQYEGQSNNAYFDLVNLVGIDDTSSFLCPVGLDSLIVQGQFNSKQFDYVQIIVKGCQYEDPSTQCASDA